MSISKPLAHEESDDGLIELIETLQGIDLGSETAELNATSISDNDGGRILL